MSSFEADSTSALLFRGCVPPHSWLVDSLFVQMIVDMKVLSSSAVASSRDSLPVHSAFMNQTEFESRLRQWNAKINFAFRISDPYYKADKALASYIDVYHFFIARGFRYRVPQLVVDYYCAYGLCLSQLAPASWALISAYQVLKDLLGVNVSTMDICRAYTVKSVIEDSDPTIWFALHSPRKGKVAILPPLRTNEAGRDTFLPQSAK